MHIITFQNLETVFSSVNSHQRQPRIKSEKMWILVTDPKCVNIYSCINKELTIIEMIAQRKSVLLTNTAVLGAELNITYSII